MTKSDIIKVLSHVKRDIQNGLHDLSDLPSGEKHVSVHFGTDKAMKCWSYALGCLYPGIDELPDFGPIIASADVDYHTNVDETAQELWERLTSLCDQNGTGNGTENDSNLE